MNTTTRIALFTGATRGIGLETVRQLAAAGVHTLLGGRDLNKATEAVKTLQAEGLPVEAIALDVGDAASITAAAAVIEAEHGRLDILVNNAGTIMRKPAAEHPDEYWDPVLSVNLDAPFILARELGKEMLERGWGKVLFTCSLLSFQGGITVPGYAASKGAVASLVKALANEWASKGINVNGIAPGYIATDNTEALRNDAVRSKSIMDRIPAGRWGEAEDFKGITVFLCSDAAAYVHGTIVTVDGGWMGR